MPDYDDYPRVESPHWTRTSISPHRNLIHISHPVPRRQPGHHYDHPRQQGHSRHLPSTANLSRQQRMTRTMTHPRQSLTQTQMNLPSTITPVPRIAATRPPARRKRRPFHSLRVRTRTSPPALSPSPLPSDASEIIVNVRQKQSLPYPARKCSASSKRARQNRTMSLVPQSLPISCPRTYEYVGSGVLEGHRKLKRGSQEALQGAIPARADVFVANVSPRVFHTPRCSI